MATTHWWQKGLLAGGSDMQRLLELNEARSKEEAKRALADWAQAQRADRQWQSTPSAASGAGQC